MPGCNGAALGRNCVQQCMGDVLRAHVAMSAVAHARRRRTRWSGSTPASLGARGGGPATRIDAARCFRPSLGESSFVVAVRGRHVGHRWVRLGAYQGIARGRPEVWSLGPSEIWAEMCALGRFLTSSGAFGALFSDKADLGVPEPVWRSSATQCWDRAPQAMASAQMWTKSLQRLNQRL